MGNAWWNLTLRFLLELAALLGLGMVGWSFAVDFSRWILAARRSGAVGHFRRAR
ncbi:hypothetical protein [Mesorhizobium sp. B2-8-9]|uniref:hypothetical protein n=1 Tax=Mesorhizobium sp. B2-8-9 TaxID=2589899 RepID=UPI001FEECD62|nr:hypothetical protein [Mesorhizobium sp. B2-8-9]